MRKFILFVFSILIISACGPSEEQKAEKYLDLAKASFQDQNFTKAKLQIDSIKLLHPKAFNTRKAANRFMLQIEQEEQLRSLEYLDSLKLIKQKELEAIHANYKFEKDEEYQDIGNYIIPEQTVEKNINRTYLRFQVNERGVMSMTSIYSNPKGINHHSIKLNTTDGTFVETPFSTDTFSTTNLGVVTEKSDFKLGEDGDVIPFIKLYKDKQIKVTFIGDRPYSYYLTKTEKKAALEIEKLTRILYALNEIHLLEKEAHLKLKFVQGRIAKTDSLDQLKEHK